MKKIIKMLAVSLFFASFVKPVMALDVTDQVKLTLMENAHIVTQYADRDAQIALVDSVVLIGKHRGESIFDIQGGIFGNAQPDTVEESGLKWGVQGYLKLSPFVRDYVKLANHWQFLNALKYGVVGGYNLTDDDWYGRLQVGLEFTIKPNFDQ